MEKNGAQLKNDQFKRVIYLFTANTQNFILKCADRNDNGASLENGVSYYKTELKNDVEMGF